MATATARMTLGSVFATVGTAANAVTSVLDTGVAGIAMLDTYVKDMSTRQAARSKADMDDFIFSLVEEKAQERTERQIQVQEFCAKSEDHQRFYAANYNRLMSILAPAKSVEA